MAASLSSSCFKDIFECVFFFLMIDNLSNMMSKVVYTRDDLLALRGTTYELWLNDNMPDSCVNLPSFSTVRGDRDAKVSRKNRGGD